MKVTSRARGATAVLRNLARSDGSVTTAIPAITVQDDSEAFAAFIPFGTVFVNNWVVPEAQRVAFVDDRTPSRQRQFQEQVWNLQTLRIYPAGQSFSVWLSWAPGGDFLGWYGNLEAILGRTPLGLDTQDHALDLVIEPSRTWRWKDEAEFQRRLEVGLDTAAFQAGVRAAGLRLLSWLEEKRWPFDGSWEHWRPPSDWQSRPLPADWARDFGTGPTPSPCA